jgi:hypothetical protein
MQLGDRPISRVPDSCFAMANLSPFQRGFGSLQLFSVYQFVPRGRMNEFKITGLRQDEYTARAPGCFKEVPPDDFRSGEDEADDALWTAGKRLPGETAWNELQLLPVQCLFILTSRHACSILKQRFRIL